MSDDCGSCRFYKESRADVGNCRVNPPQLIAKTDRGFSRPDEWSQVVVYSDSWCGMHEVVPEIVEDDADAQKALRRYPSNRII